MTSTILNIKNINLDSIVNNYDEKLKNVLFESRRY